METGQGMERVDAGLDVLIRPMRAEDVETVLGIESRVFTTPWQTETFMGLIGRPGSELWVMEHPVAGIVAYAVLWCILDQGELANIAVRPDHLGQGYASQLLRRVLDIARGREVETIYLEVRASNTRAVELYERFGFSQIGVRKMYYDKPREDALVMRIEL
jgi:ribosomal-protein-alanine N-acetyltransferase